MMLRPITDEDLEVHPEDDYPVELKLVSDAAMTHIATGVRTALPELGYKDAGGTLRVKILKDKGMEMGMDLRMSIRNRYVNSGVIPIHVRLNTPFPITLWDTVKHFINVLFRKPVLELSDTSCFVYDAEYQVDVHKPVIGFSDLTNKEQCAVVLRQLRSEYGLVARKILHDLAKTPPSEG